MKNVKQILVAVDFSDCSHALANQAAQLAAQLDARLLFLNVVAPPSGLDPEAIIFPSKSAEGVGVVDYLKSDAERKMPRYIEDAANREGVPATCKVVVGSPVETILAEAEALPADMIFLGSHGRTGLNRLVLGSVSERVLRHAEVPCMVIRNIHRHECEASSCATCASGTSDHTLQARAELDG